MKKVVVIGCVLLYLSWFAAPDEVNPEKNEGKNFENVNEKNKKSSSDPDGNKAKYLPRQSMQFTLMTGIVVPSSQTKRKGVLAGFPVMPMLMTAIRYGLFFPFTLSNDPGQRLFKHSGVKLGTDISLSPMFIKLGISGGIIPVPFYSLTVGYNFQSILTGVLGDVFSTGNQTANSISHDLSLKNQAMFNFSMISPKRFRRWTGFMLMAGLNFNYQQSYIFQNEQFIYVEYLNDRFGGWSLSTQFMLGYQIPVFTGAGRDNNNSSFSSKIHKKSFTITPGFMFSLNNINLSHFNDSLMNTGGYGSDFVFISFGPTIGLSLPYNFSLQIMATFGNERLYTDESRDKDLPEKVYQGWAVNFKMLGINFSWGF